MSKINYSKFYSPDKIPRSGVPFAIVTKDQNKVIIMSFQDWWDDDVVKDTWENIYKENCLRWAYLRDDHQISCRGM